MATRFIFYYFLNNINFRRIEFLMISNKKKWRLSHSIIYKTYIITRGLKINDKRYLQEAITVLKYRYNLTIHIQYTMRCVTSKSWSWKCSRPLEAKILCRARQVYGESGLRRAIF